MVLLSTLHFVEVEMAGGPNPSLEMLDLAGDCSSVPDSSLLDDVGYVENLDDGENWLLSVNVRSIVANRYKIDECIRKENPSSLLYKRCGRLIM